MVTKVLVFVSEVLALHTLVRIVHELEKDSRIGITVIHDGFCTEMVDKQGIGYRLIPAPFSQNVNPFVRESDLILSGKSYVQPSELELLDNARSLHVPYFLCIPDMGGQIVRAKLTDRRNGGLFLPDKIFVADPRTHDYLMRHGIPKELLVPAGNPYIDALAERIGINKKKPKKKVLAYVSTPFELDHNRGIFDIPYTQARFIQDIKRSAEELNLELIAKKHTQLNQGLLEGINTYDGDTISLILEAQVVVGSYSTALIEAAFIGTPTVSYQPWPQNIREDVFRGRIPIAKSYQQLIEELSKAGTMPRKPSGEMTYNPGRSLDTILDHIYFALYLKRSPWR